MIKVICGIIYKDDEIFICRRKSNKSLGGFWEFPGGKIEKGESHEDSLKRELMEELHMEVEVIEYYDSVKYDYGDFAIELIAYTCSFRNWNLSLTDHDLYEWVMPGETLNWKLSPADIPLVKRLVDEGYSLKKNL